MKEHSLITITDRNFWEHERLLERLTALGCKKVADGVWEGLLDEKDRRDLEGLYGPVLRIELYHEMSTP